MKLGLLKVTCLMKGCIWGEISMSMLTSLVAQTVKRLSTKRETQVRSLVWEDPVEKENGNPLQYSCLENPMDGGAW